MKRPQLLLILFVSTLSAAASADNAALQAGGQPMMMSDHPTVKMASEQVLMTIHYDHVDVDCTFYFVNTGPAVMVKMGFPDVGLFAYSGSLGRSNFTSFKSFIDGKPATTTLEVNKTKKEQWQVKNVPFAAKGEHVVREVYSTQMGGIAAGPGIAMANYVMQTGSSWHGLIGSARLTVIFDPDSEAKLPLEVHTATFKTLITPDSVKKLDDRSYVLAAGFSKPVVDKNRIEFDKTDFKPNADSDIWIVWRFAARLLREQRAKSLSKAH